MATIWSRHATPKKPKVLSEKHVSKQTVYYNTIADQVESASLEDKAVIAFKAVYQLSGRKGQAPCAIHGDTPKERTSKLWQYFKNLLSAKQPIISKQKETLFNRCLINSTPYTINEIRNSAKKPEKQQTNWNRWNTTWTPKDCRNPGKTPSNS